MERVASHTEQVTRKRPAGPGDGGPCPIFGREMAEKVYEERLPTFSGKRVVFRVSQCSGRYWHMRHEHAIMEDYLPPLLPDGRERPVP